MALLVYKFSNYENTAEREQYRSLCKKLKSCYAKKDEICIFIANYNIYDCELDGIIIKQDAIIAVEFKNYKGEVIAVDNGHWKLSDGTIIKGGSRKTVYQQANLNHVAIKRGFKDGDVLPAKKVKDVSALVVFHQAITLVNNLTPRTQSWLHVCDETSFIAKVQDITSRSTDLSVQDMLTVIEKLNLTDEYLDQAYSNKDFFENLPKNEDEPKEVTEEVIEEKTIDSEQKPEPEESQVDTTVSVDSEEIDEELLNDELKEVNAISRYFDKILSVILKNRTYKKSIYKSKMAQSLFDEQGIKLSNKYVIIVEGDELKSVCKRLSKFMNINVEALRDNIIYWQYGTPEEGDQEENDPIVNDANDGAYAKPIFRKSSTSLPHWLDRFIFYELNAVYSPFDQRFEYNLDLNRDEIKIYLGTYFPRSYGELFCIADNLMQNEAVLNNVRSKDRVRIFDFGCGTGGELIGLMTALVKYNINCFDVYAYDGSSLALEYLQEIIGQFQLKQGASVQIKAISNSPLKSYQDIDQIIDDNNGFDFILCDKVICELISRDVITENAYSVIADKLTSILDDHGLLILLDVTTKDRKSGLFYPQLMNKQLNSFIARKRGLATLLPIACDCSDNCRDLCFMQQQFYISHSHKQKDNSRVCYRVITSLDNKETIIGEQPKNAQHIIHPERFSHGDFDSTCSKLTGNNYIDSFNINIK